MLFYKDIQKYSKEEYAKALAEKYFGVGNGQQDQYVMEKLEEDYSGEITYNSFVAVRKYQYFKIALGVEVLSMALLMILVVGPLICNMLK